LGIVILVPQGAECQAVKRGLGRSDHAIGAIPAGLAPVRVFLAQQQWDTRSIDRVYVLGLCGGLRSDLAIGDAVVYASCQNFSQQVWQCEAVTIANAKSVRAISSNKVIATVTDKRFIRERYGCDVVDMEGTAILEYFAALAIPVTIVRVVSDDAAGDIPDLSAAIDRNGKLQSGKLAIGLIKEPKKGLRLVRGAIVGLRALEKVAGAIGSTMTRPTRS
jgi:nucleoside phosphorylase